MSASARSRRYGRTVGTLVAGVLAAAQCLAQAHGPSARQAGATGPLSDEHEAPEVRSALSQPAGTARPVLTCLPTALRREIPEEALGEGEESVLRLTIRNDGGQELSWVIRWTPEWLKPKERRGQLRGQEECGLELVVDPDRLPRGEARGEILIAAPHAALRPVVIPVALYVGIPVPPGIDRTGRVVRTSVGPDLPGRAGGQVPRFGGPSAGRFGARTGYVDFGASQEGDIEGAAVVGVFLGRAFPKGPLDKFSYEIGVDLARPEATDGSYISTLLAGRFDVLFPVGARGGPLSGFNVKPYLLSGVKGFVEFAAGRRASYTNYAGALSLGAGVGLGGGRFDLRATYSVLLASRNSLGIALLSAGVLF